MKVLCNLIFFDPATEGAFDVPAEVNRLWRLSLAALLWELKPFLYHKEGGAGSPICSFVYFQFGRTEARAVNYGLVPISDSR